MGRWLEKIKKHRESALTKLTKPGSVSFVTAVSSPLSKKNKLTLNNNLSPVNSTIALSKEGFVSFVTASSSVITKFEVAKVLELKTLIKQVSDAHGGDDPQLLAEYTEEVIQGWSHDLDTALACFRDLVKNLPVTK